MATRNIGTLSVDVIARIGGYEQGMDAAERRAQRLAGTIEKTTSAGAEGFRKMAEQTQNLARLSETVKTSLDPGDQTSRWARNAQAFDRAHDAARKLVDASEYVRAWSAELDRKDAAEAEAKATALFEKEHAAAKRLAADAEYVEFWNAALKKKDAAEEEAKNAQLFNVEHEAAKRLAKDSEYISWWTRELERKDAAEKRDAGERQFLVALRNTAEAAGKTRAELLQLQAARAGLSTAGAAEAQKLIAQIAATDRSFQSFNKTGRLTAMELQQVGYQVQDFFVQVSSGQNVLTAFIQQGAQLQGTFGGIGNAFRAIASTITPMRVAIGGAAAAFGLFAYGAKQVEDFNRELGKMDAVLKATGRGALFPGLKEQIDTLALLPGVSRQIATEAVGSLVRIPQLAGPIFDDLTKIVGDYARVTGKELPDAAKELGQAFADPARGAEQLEKALGTLSAETLLTVKALTDQGRVIEAQQVLYDELSAKIGGLAREGLTPLEKASNDLGASWEKLKSAFRDSGVFESVLKDVSGLLGMLAQDFKDIERVVKFLRGQKMAPPGVGVKPEGSWGPEGAPEGSWGMAPAEIDKQAKALLGVTSGYSSAAKKAGELAAKQAELNKFLKDYGDQLPATVLKELQDRVKGLQEAQSKGSKSKPFRDNIAERELQTMRETEASLRAQLGATEKLTTQQQELAKFEQQIADLKTKKVLTADQKILLANEASYRKQLQINAELSVAVDAHEEARKAAERTTREIEKQREKASQMLTDFLAASEAIQQSIADRNQSRQEGYGDLLAGAGAGEDARRQIIEQIAIRREFDKDIRALNKRAAEEGFLGSGLYRDELAKIKAGLDEALGMHSDFWLEMKRMQGDWRIGASEAMNNYLDDVANIAGQVEDLFTGVFRGMEDALVEFVTTGKLSFQDLADSIVADITRIIIRQQITGPLAAAIGGAATGGGLLTQFLGGLFGGARADGGPAYAGSAYLVGEEGPELFVPRMSGTVIPAGQTKAMGASWNIQQTFVVPSAPDRRTQAQLAASAARGIADASNRHN